MKNAKPHSTTTANAVSVAPLASSKPYATASAGNTICLKAANVPKIEKDVPMPEGNFAVGGILGTLRSTMKRMVKGDSFAWPDNKSLYDAARQTKVKVTVRKVDGNGYRVWRVE